MTVEKPICNKVMVVDDDDALRELIGDLLSRHGFEVTLAENGRAALDQMRTGGDFRLVVMDYQMPQMDGIEACRQMRERFPETPVILMSTKPIGDTAKQMCACAFLQKPFGPHELLDCVGQHIDTDTEA